MKLAGLLILARSRFVLTKIEIKNYFPQFLFSCEGHLIISVSVSQKMHIMPCIEIEFGHKGTLHLSFIN